MNEINLKWFKIVRGILVFVAVFVLVVFFWEYFHRQSRALYIYMCGSTLESGNGAATKNIAELLSADIPDDLTVIIETGGTAEWKDYGISNEVLSRYQLKEGRLVKIETVKDASMGASDTLADFLDFCVDGYKADMMGVVLLNHGSGTINGVCFDENHNMDSLSLSEINSALAAVQKNNNQKFDFIGFDACLMATYDMAEMISKYADFMVASEEIEPSGGWNYRTLAEEFGSEHFYEQLLAGYQKKCEGDGQEAYTLSCINLKKMDLLQKEFRNYVAFLNGEAKKGLKTIVEAANHSLSFGSNSELEGYTNLIDLGHFAENTGYQKLSDALKKIVTSVCGAHKKGATGLSLFYPTNDLKQVDSYLGIKGDEKYRSFIKENYSDWEKSLVSFADSGTDREGELHFSLKGGCEKYIQKMEYNIYRFVKISEYEEVAIKLGTDTDIVKEDDGYSTDFNGRWVKWNDEFINTTAIDKSGNLTTFLTPVIREGEYGTIRFLYDVSKKTFLIQGFLPDSSEGESGRLQSLDEGDEIIPLYHRLDSNYEQDWQKGSTFHYSDKTRMKVEDLPDGNYQYYVRITDIFGNKYKSKVNVVELKKGKLRSLVIAAGDMIEEVYN